MFVRKTLLLPGLVLFALVVLDAPVAQAAHRHHDHHHHRSGISFHFSSGHHSTHHGHYRHRYHHYRHYAPRCGSTIIVPSTTIVRRTTTRVWVPGHYQHEERRVLVESGGTARQWVPRTVTKVFDDKGNLVEERTTGGYWRESSGQPRYETRVVKTWVPGHWVYRSH